MTTLANLTVTVAAASRSLCQRATVKSELGIASGTTTYDAQIDRLIVAFSLYATGPEALGREPWLQTYIERLPGLGGHYLWLGRWPIFSITSITEGTDDDTATTVDSTTYAAADQRRDRVYRADGWSHHRLNGHETYTATTGPALAYNATYRAGWVMPDQITEWSAAASVAAGAWFSATDDDEPFIFLAGGAGTTHATTEPTWPTVSGGTVVDNGITWTAYDQRLPQDLEEAALMQTIDWFRGGLQAPAGIREEQFGTHRIAYWREGVAAAINPAVKVIFARYR